MAISRSSGHFFVPARVHARLSRSQNFRLGGAAVTTEEFVRLTPAVNDRAGWIWNAHGITVPDWRVTIQFNVHGDKAGADGWAFWAISKPAEVEGPVYGLPDKWRGLCVVEPDGGCAAAWSPPASAHSSTVPSTQNHGTRLCHHFPTQPFR